MEVLAVVQAAAGLRPHAAVGCVEVGRWDGHLLACDCSIVGRAAAAPVLQAVD